MSLSSIAATGKRAARRYGYYHRSFPLKVTKAKHLKTHSHNPKMNGERLQIGPRGVPPISICVRGSFFFFQFQVE